MKNDKGISLITLLITVIVIIIISSMTIYNGINTVNDTRKKDAEDKLKIICSALLKDDTFLDFSGDTEITLTEADFDYMDLLKYYDDDYTLKLKKNEMASGDTSKTTTYELTLSHKTDMSKTYSYTFDYSLYTEKYNYNVSFDETNGVNRPILIQGMTALMPDGVTPVEDIYKDNWYSYKKTSTHFAKMKYQDKIYVWIPRFAYDIQNFYEGRLAMDVPTSAINIMFLRETSNYMMNDEVMQGEYKVHPAFSNGEIQYSGIWVEEKVRDKDTLSSAVASIASENNNAECDMHLMTNMECGALMYFMHAFDNPKDIKIVEDEYVAARVNGLGVFSSSNGFVTVYTLDESGDIEIDGVYGDAFNETPWNRVEQDYPIEDEPYLIRKFNSSRYDFTNSAGDDEAYYRCVITVK